MALLSLISNKGRMEHWNPAAHKDEENIRWCWHRAVEWINWPILLSPTLMPALLLMMPWPLALLAVPLINWFWHLSVGRHGSFLNPQLCDLGEHLITMKWLVCPVFVAFFFYRGEIVLGIITALWPFFPLLLHVPLVNRLFLFVAPQAPIRPVQEKLMLAIGYPASFVNALRNFRR
jgi:hypothetical protein